LIGLLINLFLIFVNINPIMTKCILLALVLLVHVVIILSQSVTISNNSVRVSAITSTSNTTNQLVEDYEAIDEKGQWIKILSYNGPSIISSTSSAVGVKWSQPTLLSPIKMVITGTVLFNYGQDLPGDDIKRVVLPIGSEDPSRCAALCAQESTCKAFTYVKAGYEPDIPNPSCFLKSIIPASKRDDCCVSQIRDSAILINRTLTITERNLVYVEETFVNAVKGEPIALQSLEDWYEFEKEPVDLAWSQSIKRQPYDFIPHWQYKSPAVMLQSAKDFAAIIPNVKVISSTILKEQPTFMDLENDGSSRARFSYGIAPSVLTAHSTYSRDIKPIMWPNNKSFELKYYIVASAQEKVTKLTDPITGQLSLIPYGFQTVTDLLWTHFGSEKLYNSPDAQTNFKTKELNLFESWRKDTWERFAQELYLEFPCNTSSNDFTPLNKKCSSIREKRTVWATGHGTEDDMWLNCKDHILIH
jgi:hypothetical protein